MLTDASEKIAASIFREEGNAIIRLPLDLCENLKKKITSHIN
jgi:hypothetical protein